MKRLRAIGLGLAMISSLAGCSHAGVANSSQATLDNPMVLTLAHNLSTTHITSQAIDYFAQRVSELSEGRITVRIYPNGQLGSETEVLEQLMAGVQDMTRVSAPGLATYDEAYHTFGLPFIFDDEDQYYTVMDSELMDEFFRSSEDEGFVTLTYYTSGARSFYTVDKAIRTPSDLEGLKIRVQDMRSQTDMVDALGGTPVVIPFGDIYTSLQTGIIDGAESNETALTLSNHGEVCKVFSYDEHAMIPDVLTISSKTWQKITSSDQQLLIQAAKESTQWHKEQWQVAIDEAIEKSEQMGVSFVSDVDKDAFTQATAELRDDYAAEYPGVGNLLDTIEQAKRS